MTSVACPVIDRRRGTPVAALSVVTRSADVEPAALTPAVVVAVARAISRAVSAALGARDREGKQGGPVLAQDVHELAPGVREFCGARQQLAGGGEAVGVPS
jgi:hypothetical protein